jgi:hypothetical protein
LTILAVKNYPRGMKKKTPELSEYFRAMGKKGGKARAQKLTEEERKAIASMGGRKARANRNAASNGR